MTANALRLKSSGSIEDIEDKPVKNWRLLTPIQAILLVSCILSEGLKDGKIDDGQHNVCKSFLHQLFSSTALVLFVVHTFSPLCFFIK